MAEISTIQIKLMLRLAEGDQTIPLTHPSVSPLVKLGFVTTASRADDTVELTASGHRWIDEDRR